MAIALLPAAAMGGGGTSEIPRAAIGQGRVTFSDHIAPIVHGRCVPCHNPEGDAPFSLVTYSEVRQRASQIAIVTAKRLMPPWKPEPGHGEFLGDRHLSDLEIATIRRWVGEGAPEGAPIDPPPNLGGASGWPLGLPDAIVQLPEYALGAAGPDVFRNFVVTVPGEGARFVRGLQFRPGTRAVHHANIRVDPTPASRRLDESDPTPGYEGMILRSADFPDGHFLGWTQGQGPPFGFHGRSKEAKQHYQSAVAADPTNVEARRNLGVVLMASDEPEAAVAQFTEALRQRPDWSPLLVSFAWLRAAWRESVLRHPSEAVRLAERAVALTPADASALDVLAAAYASAGRFDDAIRTALQASAAAAQSDLMGLVQQIRDRLERYRQHRPSVLP